MLLRLLDDIRFRHYHRRHAKDRARLATLSDDPYLTLMGFRSWCDGRRKLCRLCGGRCCDCHHIEEEAGR